MNNLAWVYLYVVILHALFYLSALFESDRMMRWSDLPRALLWPVAWPLCAIRAVVRVQRQAARMRKNGGEGVG